MSSPNFVLTMVCLYKYILKSDSFWSISPYAYCALVARFYCGIAVALQWCCCCFFLNTLLACVCVCVDVHVYMSVSVGCLCIFKVIFWSKRRFFPKNQYHHAPTHTKRVELQHALAYMHTQWPTMRRLLSCIFPRSGVMCASLCTIIYDFLCSVLCPLFTPWCALMWSLVLFSVSSTSYQTSQL